jgi:hypothetical protein
MYSTFVLFAGVDISLWNSSYPATEHGLNGLIYTCDPVSLYDDYIK